MILGLVTHGPFKFCYTFIFHVIRLITLIIMSSSTICHCVLKLQFNSSKRDYNHIKPLNKYPTFQDHMRWKMPPTEVIHCNLICICGCSLKCRCFGYVFIFLMCFSGTVLLCFLVGCRERVTATATQSV